jgi:hypothetical protein
LPNKSHFDFQTKVNTHGKALYLFPFTFEQLVQNMPVKAQNKQLYQTILTTAPLNTQHTPIHGKVASSENILKTQTAEVSRSINEMITAVTVERLH